MSRTTAVCVVDESDRIVRERVVATDAEALARRLAGLPWRLWKDETTFTLKNGVMSAQEIGAIPPIPS